MVLGDVEEKSAKYRERLIELGEEVSDGDDEEDDDEDGEDDAEEDGQASAVRDP